MPVKISNEHLKKQSAQGEVNHPGAEAQKNEKPQQVIAEKEVYQNPEVIPESDVETTVDVENEAQEKTVSLFGGKVNLTPKAFKICRVAVPFAVVLLCIIIVSVMINSKLSDSSKIEGRFEVVSVSSEEYIELKANNTFVMNDGEVSGKWSLDGKVITFEYSSGDSVEGRLIDGKYIMLMDKAFKGAIPSESHFDTVLVHDNSNGETEVQITFSSNGKILFENLIHNEQSEGTYKVEDNFIIISIGDKRESFLKCDDSMSSVYYQLS